MFDFWNPDLRNDSYLLICSSVNWDKIALKEQEAVRGFRKLREVIIVNHLIKWKIS